MPILVNGELILYGFVGEDFWDEGFTASQVIEALAEVGRDMDITVRINSGGGYTQDGIAIYNALSLHQGKVTVEIDAIAASSASLIAMAGDEIHMRAGALMMIHDPSRITWGTAEDHRQGVELLEKLADQMAEIYAEKSGDKVEDVRADMIEEIWLTGAEAVERGFATSAVDGRAKAVAAFDYRIYAQTPKKLVAMATKKDWSFEQKRPEVHPNEPKPKTKKETPDMSPKTQSSSAETEGENNQNSSSALAEKERIKAITQHEAAASQPNLAQHLAFETDHSVDAAVALLEAAAADGAATSEGEDDEAGEDLKAYQRSRSLAQDMANPTARTATKPNVTIDAQTIYGRLNNKEQ